MRNQKGFTLIELIIVIVVLGILAVTAAPQFFNFSGDARESAVKGLKGNIQGAYQTVYAKAAVEGKLGANATLDSGINTVYGYPSAVDADDATVVDADGIVSAASLDSSDWDYTSNGSDTVYIAPAGYITAADADSELASSDYESAKCYVSYQQTDSADTPPTVTIDVDGCTN